MGGCTHMGLRLHWRLHCRVAETKLGTRAGDPGVRLLAIASSSELSELITAMVSGRQMDPPTAASASFEPGATVPERVRVRVRVWVVGSSSIRENWRWM